MLEISSAPRQIQAHSALILVHPRSPANEIMDARSHIKGNAAIFKVGEHYTAEHRLRSYDVVFLFGTPNCLLDFNKRLHKDYWINFLTETKKDAHRRLVMWGDILNIAGSHVCIVPSKAIYVNQTGHSKSIDIETAGLNLLPHRIGYNYDPKDADTPKGVALLRLSMQQPLTMLSSDGWYEAGPESYRLIEGKIYLLADGRSQTTTFISEVDHKPTTSSSNIRPIQAIYEEEAVQPAGVLTNEK